MPEDSPLVSAPVLVTGAAGFIGFHVAKKLLDAGVVVVGLDSVNDYYDTTLKEARLDQLRVYPGFTFLKMNLADRSAMEAMFQDSGFRAIVHLAAQVGVRYSVENPYAYLESNVLGFLNVLEGCRNHPVDHLVYASSSSVYGANTRMPFTVHDRVEHPVSLYAATKKADELMAHSYAHLYGVPCTGLRFFTVYGPWGRPDMAVYKFTKAIAEGQPIDVYNYGKMKRDFTYVDDIVEGVFRVLDLPPSANPNWAGAVPDPATSSAPYRVYNIGNHDSVELMRMIEVIEKNVGKRAIKNLMPMQPGDVLETYASVEDLARDAGFRPSTPMEVGIRKFVDWYRSYHGIATDSSKESDGPTSA
jgi:UDP-glucuronate 4-epimerase